MAKEEQPHGPTNSRPADSQSNQVDRSGRGGRAESMLGEGLEPFRGRRAALRITDYLDICMKNLSNERCMFGRNCRQNHCDETYQWQYKYVTTGDYQWHNFDKDKNREIEMNYCQPGKDNCFIEFGRGEVVNIIFSEDGMYGEGKSTKLDIRRLSTISSEKFSGPLSIWTTVWRWYWEDPDSGGWKEYGAEDKHGSTSTINSQFLENKYHENPEASIPFETNNFEYILNFEKMRQENVRMETQRRVKRRPQFFRKEELLKRKFQSRSDIQVPQGWDTTQFASEEEFCTYQKLVELLPESPEYRKTADLFNETMKGIKTVKKIERIENGDLWTSYKTKQVQMRRRSCRDVPEMSLFHGTQTGLIEPICHQGFDFRLSGDTVGTRHGKGSYFARDARYSDCYAQAGSDGRKQLFVAKVLVGEYTKGDKSYVRPPPKRDENRYDLFDSCVDSETDPKIFVIFTLEQVYPEYLITYN